MSPERQRQLDAARRALLALMGTLVADEAPEIAAVSVLVFDVTRQLRSIESILNAAPDGAP